MEFFVGEAEIEIKCSVGGKDQGSWVVAMEEQLKGDEHMWWRFDEQPKDNKFQPRNESEDEIEKRKEGRYSWLYEEITYDSEENFEKCIGKFE